MAKHRHPKHDDIVEALLNNIPVKMIAYLYKVSRSTIRTIKNTAIETVYIRKFDPGEGQKNFFDVWKNL